MKIYRITHEQNILHATPVSDGFKVLEGSLETGFEPTSTTVEAERVLPPVGPSNIFGIGLNYRDHIEEGWREDQTRPDHPVVFMKATSSLAGPEDSIILPETAPDYVDFEAELAVVIGAEARDVSPENSLKYVAGFTCAIDVTARELQEHDNQWVRAKSFDTFCPLGPCLQTDWNEVGDNVQGFLNGERQQTGSFDDMLFSVSELIEFLSHQFTLLPGTTILTGTPAGVGFAQDPPRYLSPGDEYNVQIDGIGSLSLPVTEN